MTKLAGICEYEHVELLLSCRNLISSGDARKACSLFILSIDDKLKHKDHQFCEAFLSIIDPKNDHVSFVLCVLATLTPICEILPSFGDVLEQYETRSMSPVVDNIKRKKLSSKRA